MNHRDTVVSKAFRSVVESTYPQLFKHDNHREQTQWLSFLDLLLFPSFLDSTAMRIVPIVSRKEILKALGLPLKTPSKDFNAQRFLDEIKQKKVLNKFTYSPHAIVLDDKRNVVRSKAREAIPNFGKPLKAALEHELVNFHRVAPKDRVHLVSNRPWRATTPNELRARDLADAQSVPSNTAQAQTIIDYLNGLNSHLFTKRVNVNIEKAVDVAKNIAEDRIRHDQLTKLHRIVSQPQPFYGASEEQNTVRIFARNVAIQGLKNAVKYALIDGWRTFDLRCTQLAIVATDWQIPELQTWLSDFENNNIWTELCSLFPSVPPTECKPLLKTAVYSVCYGASKRRVCRDLSSGTGITSEAVESFFQHRFISAVLRRRRTERARIVNNGGAYDCFGRWVKCAERKKARSIMAQLSQAREMSLLLPAIQFAKHQENEFTIVLSEHDGFSVHFTKKDRVENMSKRIMKVVNDHCANLQYPTRLEPKDQRPQLQPST